MPGPPEAPAGIRWHAVPLSDALSAVQATAEGLSSSVARERLAQVGPNAFRPPPAYAAWRILADQLASVVVLLLVAAVGVAVLSRDWPDAAAIGAVVVLNAAIGFVTELRARRAMESLLGLEVSRARVVRDGLPRDIDARELVPGDVIELDDGLKVPADVRLLHSADLRTNEAPLTGESLPVEKSADAVLPEDTPLPERANLAYKATTVVAGHGRAVVVGTGMSTEVGRIGEMAGRVEERATPLELRLEAIGRRLVVIALGVAAVVAGLAALQGEELRTVVQTAIALAVAAVPEGLPVVATITMAVGVHRMARRQALIRRLSAVEALGSATVICADKTGTLTAAEMTVTAIWAGGREVVVTGVGYAPEGGFRAAGAPLDPRADLALARALRVAALCNRAYVGARDGSWIATGDPTEAALLVVARKAGLDPEALRADLPEDGEIPFSTARRFMATFHRAGGRLVALVKGAPGPIVSRCQRVLSAGGLEPLDGPGRDRLLEHNRRMAARGLRVIALADAERDRPGGDPLHDLTFLGFAGMLDPPAEGVIETIAAFRRAGIRTLLLTGDQRPTAEAVARELGVLGPGEGVMEGADLDRASDVALRERIARTAVVSRSSPEGKLRVIDALQRRGESVAMLGDGVNDAAALRQADIGVSMGRRGTDVAREAADVILADDRFSTIRAAIEQGRVIFDNIGKFVFYLFSCNLAEILVLLGAGLAGLPAPLLPLQILWLNLLTDTTPALALALEPGERDVMRRPPRRPTEQLLPPRLVRSTVGYALAITAVTLAAFWWGLGGELTPSRHAVTLSFTTLALAQVFHLGNARSAFPVVAPRRALANGYAVAAAALAGLLQVAAVEVDFLAGVLGLAPLSAADWGLVVGLAAAPAVGGQVLKAVRPGGAPVES